MELTENESGSAASQMSEHRSVPRHRVDEDATLLWAKNCGIPCRMVDLSVSGCQLHTNMRFMGGPLARVEVHFKIRGQSFHISGITQWTDGRHRVGIRFAGLLQRRKVYLAQVLAWIAEQKAISPKEGANGESPQLGLDTGNLLGGDEAEALPAVLVTRESRQSARCKDETSAIVYMVKIGSQAAGRVLELSRTGCLIRTDARLTVAVHTRVEVEFRLEGQAFRLGGMIQTLAERQFAGIGFQEMTSRKQELLEQLIVFIEEDLARAEAQADPEAPSSSNVDGAA